MNNYIEANGKINVTEQTKFRLSEIIGTENYFYHEINERKSYIRNLNRYIIIFEYIDKLLIILSATISIAGVPVRTASTTFTLIFSIAKGMIKTLLKIARSKKKA